MDLSLVKKRTIKELIWSAVSFSFLGGAWIGMGLEQVILSRLAYRWPEICSLASLSYQWEPFGPLCFFAGFERIFHDKLRHGSFILRVHDSNPPLF